MGSDSTDITKSSTMRILVLFTFLVSSTMGMMMGNEMMVKKWSKFKAMESCYGEDLMKTHMLKMKRAIAKCTKIEMPELDLPMYNSPYRAIQALLNGAREMEKKNMERFQEVMRTMQQTASGNGFSGNAQQTPNYVPVPYPFPQTSSRTDSKPDLVEELMK